MLRWALALFGVSIMFSVQFPSMTKAAGPPAVVATIALGAGGHQPGFLATNEAANRIYVANDNTGDGNGEVSVIDGASMTISRVPVRGVSNRSTG